MLSYSTLNFKGEIESDYLKERTYNLLDNTFTIPSSYSFNIFEVTDEYIARPDLISHDAYGDEMFADVICKLNGISNPFELNAGTKLIIPSPDYIVDFTHKPDVSENDSNWGVDKITSNGSRKQKQSKRQANESIIGDSRFKIDTTTGIIIY